MVHFLLSVLRVGDFKSVGGSIWAGNWGREDLILDAWKYRRALALYTSVAKISLY